MTYGQLNEIMTFSWIRSLKTVQHFLICSVNPPFSSIPHDNYQDLYWRIKNVVYPVKTIICIVWRLKVFNIKSALNCPGLFGYLETSCKHIYMLSLFSKHVRKQLLIYPCSIHRTLDFIQIHVCVQLTNVSWLCFCLH